MSTVIVNQRWADPDYPPQLGKFLGSSGRDLDKPQQLLTNGVWFFPSLKWKSNYLFFCNDDLSHVVVVDSTQAADCQVYIVTGRSIGGPLYDCVCGHPDFKDAQDCAINLVTGRGIRCP